LFRKKEGLKWVKPEFGSKPSPPRFLSRKNKIIFVSLKNNSRKA